MRPKTSFFIAFALVMLTGGILLRLVGKSFAATSVQTPEVTNVVVTDGRQIITIKAKGGFSPQTTTVKGGMPTVLRFETDGTYDCSSTVRIPGLGISETLPASGETDVVVGALKAGVINGTCGMGMYRFRIDVKD